MAKKINKDKIIDTLMNMPDVVWQGPLLQYRDEYKQMVKRLRQGRSGLVDEASDIAKDQAEQYLQRKEKEYPEEVAKAREFQRKIGELVQKFGETVGTVLKAVATYKVTKDTLQTISELSEKTQLIAAASAITPPTGSPGAGGPFAALSFIKRLGAKSAVRLSFWANTALMYLEGIELTLLAKSRDLVKDFSKAIEEHFGTKFARTVRAEKWGKALDDDVIRASQEYHDAADAAADAEWEFDFSVADYQDQLLQIELEETMSDISESLEEAVESIDQVVEETTAVASAAEDLEEAAQGLGVNPGYPFITSNWGTSPFGSYASAAEARQALAGKYGFSTYDQYKDGRSLTVRKSEWDGSSDIW